MQGPQAHPRVWIHMQMSDATRLLGVEKFKQDIDRAEHVASLAARMRQRNPRV